jgi:hypothetical protein
MCVFVGGSERGGGGGMMGEREGMREEESERAREREKQARARAWVRAGGDMHVGVFFLGV